MQALERRQRMVEGDAMNAGGGVHVRQFEPP